MGLLLRWRAVAGQLDVGGGRWDEERENWEVRRSCAASETRTGLPAQHQRGALITALQPSLHDYTPSLVHRLPVQHAVGRNGLAPANVGLQNCRAASWNSLQPQPIAAAALPCSCAARNSAPRLQVASWEPSRACRQEAKTAGSRGRSR